MRTGPSAAALLIHALLSSAGCTEHDTEKAPPSRDTGVSDDASREDAAVDPEDAELPDGADEGGDSADGAEEPAPDQLRVTITFKGKVGDHAYACGESYPGQGATKITARGRDFRFFVHGVRLIDAAGEEVPLALEERAPAQDGALALLDFNNPDGRCASLGGPTNITVTGHVPPGVYHGIAFSVGVPEALNHGDPALALAPLRGSGMAWNWLQGYRFFVGELASEAGAAGGPDLGNTGGMADAAVGDADVGAQDDTEPGLGVLHLGSTGCVGSPAKGISCAKQNRSEIRLSNFDPERDSIVADLGAVFAEIDLAQGAECHARGVSCASMFAALGIDLESGAVLDSQTFFRVE